jgi:hypothetical protein
MSQGEVFTRYRALFSSSSIPPYQNENIKKINDLEFVDFLFELIKASKGQKQYKNIILKGVFGELKRKSDINIKIRKVLKSFFACEQDILIPTTLTTNSVAGINMGLSEIDPHGLLHVNANSQLGKHLYEGNDPAKHVNYLLSLASQTGADKPVNYSYKGRVLFESYAANNGALNFKFGEYYANKPLADWVVDYIDSTSFFNLPNFTSMLMDMLTGALSLKAGKKKLQIAQDSRIIRALKKIFGFCSEKKSDGVDSSLNEYLADVEIDTSEGDLNNTSDDFDAFNFTPEELKDIERDADNRSKGSVKFSTCGDLDIEFDPEQVIAGLDLLFGAYKEEADRDINDMVPAEYDNNDAFFNIDNVNNFFDDMLKSGAKKVIDAGEDDLHLSFPNMQAELQMGIFKAIPYALIKSVLGPKLLMIQQVSAAVINQQKGGVATVSSAQVINKITPILRNVGLQVVDGMLKGIFSEISKDILKLTKELAVRYVKQRGADYILTLTSLLRLLKKLKSSDKSRCKSVISKLLALLNLGSFGKMPSIPGPLILIGGALKPGLNRVAMVNDLKSKLQQKGIETAPFFPDGTPNYLMYALEETMAVMIEHIKTRAKIDTFAMGPTGPVKGFGQIQ